MKSVYSNLTHRYSVISAGDWMPYWSEDEMKQVFLCGRLGTKSP